MVRPHAYLGKFDEALYIAFDMQPLIDVNTCGCCFFRHSRPAMPLKRRRPTRLSFTQKGAAILFPCSAGEYSNWVDQSR
jgi:hypothetical protein